jgi:N-glycosylase/DNA lyase
MDLTSKNVDKNFKIIDDVVEEVGKENAVQIVTTNGVN